MVLSDSAMQSLGLHIRPGEALTFSLEREELESLLDKMSFEMKLVYFKIDSFGAVKVAAFEELG